MKPTIPCLKKSFVAVLLGVTTLPAYAQNSDLKEKKTTLNDDSRITYHVKNNNIKQGAYYIKTEKTKQLILKGAYTDNQRSGIWYFFNETGKPESVYSFQQRKLVFIDPALLNKLTINIPGQEKEVAENAKIPVLLSPMALFLAELSNNMAIPEEHFKSGESLPIRIKAEVDEIGHPTYYIRYAHNGKNIEREVKLKNHAFDIEWVPAEYNGKPLKSEVIIFTAITHSPDSESGHRRFRWN